MDQRSKGMALASLERLMAVMFATVAVLRWFNGSSPADSADAQFLATMAIFALFAARYTRGW